VDAGLKVASPSVQTLPVGIHVIPSTPGAASRFNQKYDCRSKAASM